MCNLVTSVNFWAVPFGGPEQLVCMTRKKRMTATAEGHPWGGEV
jgi:hypothetical protein